MKPAEMFSPLSNIGMRERSFPDNLIHKMLLAKYLIHKNFYIMANMIIQFHPNGCC